VGHETIPPIVTEISGLQCRKAALDRLPTGVTVAAVAVAYFGVAKLGLAFSAGNVTGDSSPTRVASGSSGGSGGSAT